METSNEGQRLNLRITKRARFVLTLDFPHLDLTGCTFASQLRANAGDDGDPLATFGVDVTLPHTVAITLESEVTTAIEWRRAAWDLFMIDSLGHPMRLLFGDVTAVEAVTHV